MNLANLGGLAVHECLRYQEILADLQHPSLRESLGSLGNQALLFGLENREFQQVQAVHPSQVGPFLHQDLAYQEHLFHLSFLVESVVKDQASPVIQEDPFRLSVLQYQVDLDIQRRLSLRAIQVDQSYLDIQHRPFDRGIQVGRFHL